MGKILLFVFDKMTDYEVTLVMHLLKTNTQNEIVTISYDDQVIKSASGLLYKPNKLVKDVIDDDIEGLIIPGGWFGEVRSEIVELVQRLNSQNKLLAGICGAGTFFLGVSGVLDNVSYTTPITSWTDKHIEVFGSTDPFPRENFIQDNVIVDKNIITAQGTAFIDFAIAICDWFSLFESAEEKHTFTNLFKS